MLLNGAVVPTPTLPLTPRSSKSSINPTVRVEAVISPTVISGLPVSVCAVDAVPVTFPVTFPVTLPSNVVAVKIPVKLKPSAILLSSMTGKN